MDQHREQQQGPEGLEEQPGQRRYTSMPDMPRVRPVTAGPVEPAARRGQQDVGGGESVGCQHGTAGGRGDQDQCDQPQVLRSGTQYRQGEVTPARPERSQKNAVDVERQPDGHDAEHLGSECLAVGIEAGEQPGGEQAGAGKERGAQQETEPHEEDEQCLKEGGRALGRLAAQPRVEGDETGLHGMGREQMDRGEREGE